MCSIIASLFAVTECCREEKEQAIFFLYILNSELAANTNCKVHRDSLF